MKKLISVFFFVSVLIIITFLLFPGFEAQIGTHLQTRAGRLSFIASSFLLLVGDIVLPVPSSLVMILNGKVLGFGGGTLLSLISGMACSIAGYFIGRKSSGWVNRQFSKKEVDTGNALFRRYGIVAISLSKALPVLSETLSVLSGVSGVPLRVFLLFSFIGHLSVSACYAFAGRYFGGRDSNLLSGAIMLLAITFGWLFQAWIKRKNRKAIQPIPITTNQTASTEVNNS